MSGKCGNCDCADQSQCVKKGNTLDFVETEKIRYTETETETVVMDVTEGGGKCKCGPNCSCVDCGCAH